MGLDRLLGLCGGLSGVLSRDFGSIDVGLGSGSYFFLTLREVPDVLEEAGPFIGQIGEVTDRVAGIGRVLHQRIEDVHDLCR